MHTYIRPHTHTHMHDESGESEIENAVDFRMDSLRLSSSWLNANVSRLLYCHSCVFVCVCVQVLLLLLLLCMQANGMRCLRFVSVWRTKKNCRQVKSKHRAAFDSQSGLSLCRLSLSCLALCASLCELCVALATTFDLCSEADITWPGLKWDSLRIPEIERWRLGN